MSWRRRPLTLNLSTAGFSPWGTCLRFLVSCCDLVHSLLYQIRQEGDLSTDRLHVLGHNQSPLLPPSRYQGHKVRRNNATNMRDLPSPYLVPAHFADGPAPLLTTPPHQRQFPGPRRRSGARPRHLLRCARPTLLRQGCKTPQRLDGWHKIVHAGHCMCVNAGLTQSRYGAYEVHGCCAWFYIKFQVRVRTRTQRKIRTLPAYPQESPFSPLPAFHADTCYGTIGRRHIRPPDLRVCALAIDLGTKRSLAAQSGCDDVEPELEGVHQA